MHLSIDKTSHAPAGSRRRGFGCTLPVPHVLLRSQSDLGPCPPDAASEGSTGGAKLLFRPPERGKGRRYAVTAPQRRPRSRAWILPGEEQAVGATSQPRMSVYRHRDTSPCLSQKPRSPPPGSLLSCRQRACGARSSAHTSTEIGDAKKRQTGSSERGARPAHRCASILDPNALFRPNLAMEGDAHLLQPFKQAPALPRAHLARSVVRALIHFSIPG